MFLYVSAQGCLKNMPYVIFPIVTTQVGNIFLTNENEKPIKRGIFYV